MRMRLLQLSTATLLALGAASGAFAQSQADTTPDNTAVLPIINSDAGNKAGAYLLREPTEQSQFGARWRLGGKNKIDAGIGLDAGDSQARLCTRASRRRLSTLAKTSQ